MSAPVHPPVPVSLPPPALPSVSAPVSVLPLGLASAPRWLRCRRYGRRRFLRWLRGRFFRWVWRRLRCRFFRWVWRRLRFLSWVWRRLRGRLSRRFRFWLYRLHWRTCPETSSASAPTRDENGKIRLTEIAIASALYILFFCACRFTYPFQFQYTLFMHF